MNRSITLSELKKLSPQLIGSKIKIVSIVKGMKYTLLGVITFTKNIHQGRRINYTTVYFDTTLHQGFCESDDSKFDIEVTQTDIDNGTTIEVDSNNNITINKGN